MSGYSGYGSDGLLHRYDEEGRDLGLSRHETRGHSSQTGGLIEDEDQEYGDREDQRKDSLIGGFLRIIGFGPSSPVAEMYVEWDEEGGVGSSSIRTVDSRGRQSIVSTPPEYVEPPSSDDDDSDDKDDFKFFIFF
jgi:hypothetical protein